MNFKKLSAALFGIVMAVSFNANAGFITGEDFNIGLNTGYAVGAANSPTDQAVDWFIFDSNGVDAISFYFNRTIAAPDLIAGFYAGDTYGFDYVAAGVPLRNWSYYDAASYNTNLTYIRYYDDTHNDLLGGPYGDPDFSQVLSAGRYSLALSSFVNAGSYEFTTNVSSAYSQVPEPTTLAIFALGIMGLALRRFKKQ